MKETRIRVTERCRTAPLALLGFLLVWGAVSVEAKPPRDPLPAPYYSFDVQSPKVLEGLVHPDAVLMLEDESPVSAADGSSLDLGVPGDDVDALSRNHIGLMPEQPFAILFSVDYNTDGLADPDPTLVERYIPYNPKDQAGKGQEAGDQYMSTVICTLAGGCTLLQRGLTSNSTLVRNNFDEGGTDFGADPPTSAEETASRGDQDNVDATSGFPVAGPTGDILEVFFSAAAGSPSLPDLSAPFAPSGANIFFNARPADVPTETMVYATAADLGLGEQDDIDGMLVLDADGDHGYSPGDRVIFSLTPGSPFLTAYLGAEADAGGAYVFSVTYGEDPVEFVSAADLGLGATHDNVDALDYVLCSDPELCAADHAILSPLFPAIAGWGLVVMTVGGLAIGTALFRRSAKRSAV